MILTGIFSGGGQFSGQDNLFLRERETWLHLEHVASTWMQNWSILYVLMQPGALYLEAVVIRADQGAKHTKALLKFAWRGLVSRGHQECKSNTPCLQNEDGKISG